MKRGQQRGQQMDPIARWVRSAGGEILLLCQNAAATHYRVSERTVRRRCEPIACDVETRTPLYDDTEAGPVLDGVRARPGATVAAQRTRGAMRFQMAS